MWKYCNSIFQLRSFIFYIIFPVIQFILIHTFSFLFFLFLFSCFSPPHTCPAYLYPPQPFFYFLFLPHIQEHSSNSHSLFFFSNSLSLSLSFEKQRREWEKKRKEETEMREKKKQQREWEKKIYGGERKNWYNSSWCNFLIKKIQLLMYSSSSDLMSYCSWAKKNSRFRESIENHFFGLILYYRDYFAFSYTIGDALNKFFTIKHICRLFKPLTFQETSLSFINKNNSHPTTSLYPDP